jgi:hypothetical protein
MNHPIDHRGQRFAGFGEHEIVRRLRPVQLKTGGERGNPHLARWGIGGYHKFAGWLFKQNIQHAILFFHFKTAVLFGRNQILLKCFHSGIAVAAKCSLV